MKQKRILLADDEAIFLKAVSCMLCDNGYICDSATDAESVVAMLKLNDYDLLISDVRMPGNSELELISNISKITNCMPIILVTAYPSVDNTIQALKLNVHDYLIKPVDFEELLALVNKVIIAGSIHHDVNREVRKSISNWRLELDKVEKLLSRAPTDSPLETFNYYLDTSYKNIFETLMNLRKITKMAVVGNDDQLVNQPVYLNGMRAELKEVLEDTVKVLKKTKNSFKSKDIGELRKKLEKVLSETI